MSALKSKKKKYLVFMFLSWIVLLLSISDIICYFNDQNRVNKTIEQLQSTFKEEKYTKMGLINPPEDENDSYWNYANEPFLQVDFS